MTFQILITSRSFRQSQGKHWEILQQAGCEVIDSGLDRALTEEELCYWLRNVDGAILGVDPVTRQVVESTQRLMVISRQGVGIDSIDIPACTERGIIVTNTPGSNTGSVAEMTIALMFALLRQIPQSDQRVKAGKWSRLLGSDLEGKSLGFVGFGRIAREVARKVASFNVRILYFDVLRAASGDEAALGAQFTSLEDLLSKSDIVSLHAVVTPETTGMINRERLSLMKSSSFLINTARGELVHEADLAAALKAGQIAGAASDVFAPEPPTGSPLLELDNFIATPHIGAYTAETNVRVAVAAAENLVVGLQGNRPGSVVNPEVYEILARR